MATGAASPPTHKTGNRSAACTFATARSVRARTGKKGARPHGVLVADRARSLPNRSLLSTSTHSHSKHSSGPCSSTHSTRVSGPWRHPTPRRRRRPDAAHRRVCACPYRAPHRSDLGDLFLANNKSDEAADCYRHRNKLDGGNANGARLPLAPQAREVAPTQPTAAARQQQYQQQWVSSSSGAPAGTQPRAKKAQSSAGTAAGRPRGIARPPPALPTASDSAPATTSSSAPAAGAAAGVPAAVKRGPGRPRKHPLPST